jgi:hypothetical protein
MMVASVTVSVGPMRPRCQCDWSLVRREAILAKTLVDLADTLVAELDLLEPLGRLAERCVEVLDVVILVHRAPPSPSR